MTRLVSAGIVGLLASVFIGLAAEEVSATGSVCFEKRAARGSHTIQKYSRVAGWGWTNWAVQTNISAVDSCNRGTINVSIHLPNSSVDAKGGAISVKGVYRDGPSTERTKAAGNWIPLKHAPISVIAGEGFRLRGTKRAVNRHERHDDDLAGGDRDGSVDEAGWLQMGWSGFRLDDL